MFGAYLSDAPSYLPTGRRERGKRVLYSEMWLLGIFGVYLSVALSDLHTGKERGEQADPSQS